MLTTMKNNRSLTFYQQTAIPRSQVTPSYAGGIASVAVANTSFVTTTATLGFNAQIGVFRTQITDYNTQLSKYLIDLNTLRANDIQTLDLTSPNSTARNIGVKRAWQYEQADVDMGGAGSANWNEAEQQEILAKGKIQHKPVMDTDGNPVLNKSGTILKDGPEGHHQQNVADHPEQQANPDNIKFYKDRQEHLEKGHGGDFNNETDAPLINKDQMLKDTNDKRVTVKEGEITQTKNAIFKNELRGLGIAVAIGLGVGVTIGFVITLAQSGVTPESIKLAAIEGAKGGLEAGALAAAGYGVGRTIGEVASKAVGGMVQNLGVTLTENISRMVNMGVIGSLTIIVFSAYQFIKLRRMGFATREALLQAGKQALFSLSLLAVSIAAQGIWGGPAGIIVSLSVGIILISYTVIISVHQRQFAERVRIYTINKCYPSF